MTEFFCVRCDNYLPFKKMPNLVGSAEYITCFFCNCEVAIYANSYERMQKAAHVAGWSIAFSKYRVYALEYWKPELRKIGVSLIIGKHPWDDPWGEGAIAELPYIDPKHITEEKIEKWLFLR